MAKVREEKPLVSRFLFPHWPMVSGLVCLQHHYHYIDEKLQEKVWQYAPTKENLVNLICASISINLHSTLKRDSLNKVE